MSYRILAVMMLVVGCAPSFDDGPTDELEWLPRANVTIENWYVGSGGSTAASAWVVSSAPILKYQPRPALDTCTSVEGFPAENTCTPGCDTGQYCGDDGACHARLDWLDAGTIAITDGAQTLELEFDDDGSCDRVGCYAPSSVLLLQAGVALEVSSSSFAGSTRIPTDLILQEPTPAHWPAYVEVTNGSDLDFEWTTGSGGGEVEIHITSLYGGSVLCHPADDGQFTVPWEHLQVIPQGTNEVEAFLTRGLIERIESAAGPVDLRTGSVDTTTLLITP